MDAQLAQVAVLLSDLNPILEKIGDEGLDQLEEIGAVGDKLRFLLDQCDNSPETVEFVLKQGLATQILFRYRPRVNTED